ncbi:probable E3 ubiquitin-protein ligase ARI2 isoform X2 [Chenopodium quinoa]|uniref:probable E3 ubiquitin-protein ligase ARI2 isoform X2 n=1 Tax=Chenopodium quinoa TaxID=63459 RepID=UPI000B7720BB|nr:probable E3 ubiquitin-protein ligase ARI2 isoform X2 [Chenopodium quinoa]XP_021738549.1 probable E3 ubiquitin-protein ligase ARI2 isoform X2 [Chenopodium quinoa]
MDDSISEADCDYYSHNSSDDDDDLEFDDIKTDHQCHSLPSCQVITSDSLLAAQWDVLQRVMDLLMVGVHHARTLLIHYHWDVDKLVTVFVEKGKDHLFAEAGVKMVKCPDLGTYLSPSSTLFCNVCMEDVRYNETTQMDCQHTFCNNCWTEHFIMQIREGHSRRIKCMSHKCNTICDESVIRNLVSKRDQDLAKKFDRFLLESYIEENKLVKWCPSVPHCGNAIRVEGDVLCEVGCTCGLQFCFSCLSEAHSPCSCLMWELWTKKWKDESMNLNWIKINTKNCPSCHKPVEKNGGCNIVRCLCGKPFCWVCMQARSYNHACGRYVDPDDSVELRRKTLYRYRHYYERFKAHRDSLNLETELEKTVRMKISFCEEETGLREFNWLEKGMCVLFRSRRALSYSYAFAFYMFGDELFKNDLSKREKKIKQNLFEDQQQQFEANVEKLSRLIEEPLDKYSVDEEVKAIRSKVIILSNVVGKCCKSMYDCIENDLLGCLRCNIHNIAPYRSDGVEKASEFSASLSNMGSQGIPSEEEINGWMVEIDESSKFDRSNKRSRVS